MRSDRDLHMRPGSWPHILLGIARVSIEPAQRCASRLPLALPLAIAGSGAIAAGNAPVRFNAVHAGRIEPAHYQRSNREPTRAPAAIKGRLASGYQVATNSGESSKQCRP